MNKGSIAKEYFCSGYNCSQSVAMAFANEMNMDVKTVARLTIGFGGGVGRMREVCGTVTGMTFVLSSLFGDKPKNEVYAMVQDVAGKFKEENGSIVCRELLGLSEKTPITSVSEERTKSYYKKRPCAELVEMAADILDSYLKDKK